MNILVADKIKQLIDFRAICDQFPKHTDKYRVFERSLMLRTLSNSKIIFKLLVSGGYSEWTVWSTCNVTCGVGNQERQRTCSNPSPENGGRNCTLLGDGEEKRSCKENEPPGKVELC